VEAKDRELTNLQSQIGGLNVVKSLLKEKENENCTLKQEVSSLKKGSPINLHNQCEQTISLLKA